MTSQIIILAFLLVLSGVFSGSETALMSLSEAKLRSLGKRKGVGIIGKLKSDPHKLLITILIGNNLVNIGASVLMTAFVTSAFGSQWLGAITGVLTFLILIFGEIIPKTVAQTYSVRFALISSPLIYFLQKILWPFVIIFDFISAVVLRLLGDKEKTLHVTEEELQAMVDISAESGAIEKSEKEMIDAVLEFEDTRVEEVMTSQAQIIAIRSDKTIDDAINLVAEEGYSRLPVYHDRLSDILGILHVQDLLKFKKEMRGDTKLSEIDLGKAFFVPKAKSIAKLFKELQWNRTHLALVADEHGSVVGLVTLEDILEELVGEIVDEHDDIDEENKIQKLNGCSWRVGGDTELENLREATGVEFENYEDHKTVAHVILEELQHIPKRGDSVKLQNLELVVEKMIRNRIDSVRVKKF